MSYKNLKKKKIKVMWLSRRGSTYKRRVLSYYIQGHTHAMIFDRTFDIPVHVADECLLIDRKHRFTAHDLCERIQVTDSIMPVHDLNKHTN